MVKCENCNKKVGSVQFECKYCPLTLCLKCRGLETHKCQGISSKIEDDLKTLDKKLDYKVVKQHELLHT